MDVIYLAQVRLGADPLGGAGEESAGATFLRHDGSVWTADKDGLVPALLAAEIVAQTGHSPADLYRQLTLELGEPFAEKIRAVLTRVPGNNASIDGIKVATEKGWFAARPSGTEAIYKIYAESFYSQDHLQRILEQAQTLVAQALAN